MGTGTDFVMLGLAGIEAVYWILQNCQVGKMNIHDLWPTYVIPKTITAVK